MNEWNKFATIDIQAGGGTDGQTSYPNTALIAFWPCFVFDSRPILERTAMTIKHFFERRSPGDRFFRAKKFDSKTSFSIQQVFRRDTLDCWWKNRKARKKKRRRGGGGKKKKKRK